MPNVEKDLDRILAHLRAVIEDYGFTQIELQNALGWGPGYISQLLTQQKGLRFDHILMILNVVGVAPGAFFARIYRSSGPGGSRRRSTLAPPSTSAARSAPPLHAEARRLKHRLDQLVSLLKQRGIVDDVELAEAVERSSPSGNA